MPHSICTVSRRPPATKCVPHEERLILQVAHHAVLLDNLPDNRRGVTLAVNLVL